MSIEEHPFALDPFQLDAITAIDAGRSVLVSAPTGSGKTVIAEHAIGVALAERGRAFYTTPIKALSNQKFHDLVAEHGAEKVGLLTGDTAVNGEAPIVVMTTEVLRNMIHSRAGSLATLRWVILDEVHYLQDTYRGSVWEEVMIHLPAPVRLVCLSATVSNAPELADWISTVRGPTDVVVETQRPVTLDNWYLVEDRLEDTAVMVPTLVDGRPNPDGFEFDTGPREVHRSARGGRPQRRWSTPGRAEVVELLDQRQMLPTLYFLFSRAGCDEAVRSCLRAGLSFTTDEERDRIRAIAEQHVENLTDDDLRILDFGRWSDALQHGIAAHHAGMIPPFKEAVERCFIEGLVKVVFATETLALGINMPARSVVIEKLTKFTGDGHDLLTAAQFTQLTGRAGRRGIDAQGHAVVLWSPFVGFEEVSRLVASRSFRLTSSFRPTYNIAANLVRRFDPAEAHRLLTLSFAQYQADADIVRLQSRIEERRAALDALEAEARCSRGDVGEYRRLLDEGRRPPGRGGAVETAIGRLRPGDIISVDGGRPVAVLSVSQRRGGSTRLKVIDEGLQLRPLGAADMDEPPDLVARVTLPVPFAPTKRSFQTQVAAALREAGAGRAGRRSPKVDVADPGHHPVHDCPRRDAHLRALRRAERARGELRTTEERIRTRADSLAEQFDRVLQVLEDRGHLTGWALSGSGETLVSIFHESDLLITEVLHAGVLDGLDAPTLAGLVSGFVHERRASAPELEEWFPSSAVASRARTIMGIAEDLARDERRLGLPATRLPDMTFLPLAHGWAAGEDLGHVLAEEEVSGGDFVRTVKQLIDLLRQIGDAAPDPQTAQTARAAADALLRGVVAASVPVAASTPEETAEDAERDRSSGSER
ncbi:MAG: DEAD/DEAH box helicase [Acidobacteria bacterium]|nr:DEAD/DEAH box helicase [Acidobacteriota bacterium]